MSLLSELHSAKKDPQLIDVVMDNDLATSNLSENIDNIFASLHHINVLLTNGCNLECSYCFEQHKNDYAKWTVENLNKVYDFLRKVPNTNKVYQFFGGEPLLKVRLIDDFLENLTSPDRNISIRIVTNGVYLTKEFIDKFYAKNGDVIIISIDSLKPDCRSLTPDHIAHIIDMIAYICANYESNKIHIRTTISPDTVHDLKDLLNTMEALGVEGITVHPLSHSLNQGIIEWSDEDWEVLRNAITIPDDNLMIYFAEGVGDRKVSNCLTGNGMIAVDATGDFSGCYFINNLKGLVPFELGNIFKDIIYPERYIEYTSQYNDMHELLCKDCELTLCYQCPVGNTAQGLATFTPTPMCKKIIELHKDIKKKSLLLSAKRKYLGLYKFLQDTPNNGGESEVLFNILTYSMYGYKLETKNYPPIENLLAALIINNRENIKIPEQDLQKWILELTPCTYQDVFEYMNTFVNINYTESSVLRLLYVHIVFLNTPQVKPQDLSNF